MNGNRIKGVKARQILDSKGRPVVETEIHTENGKIGRARASTGTSAGKNESHVLRNNNKELFGDLSIFKAVKNIEEIIGSALVSMNVTDQQAVDRRVIKLDGTRYKTNLGGNAIYSVSYAAAKAVATDVGKPLWRYLTKEKSERVFALVYNMINGGTYGDYTLVFQGFIMIPKNVSTFYEGPKIGVEVFQEMGDIIKRYSNGKPPVMGNYSGYGAPSDDPLVLFDMLMEAASSLRYEDEIIFPMDCVVSEIYDETRGAYPHKGTYINRGEMISLLFGIAYKYPIGFIEDALQEEDSKEFKKAGKEMQAVLIGDDFMCSGIDRAKKAIDMDAIQRMMLEPDQISTLTEAAETARFVKQHDLLVVASGRAGEVIDGPNAELAIAPGLPVMKTGTPRSGERTIFTNTGLRVGEQLKSGKTMADIPKVPGFEWLE